MTCKQISNKQANSAPDFGTKVTEAPKKTIIM